jgi:polyhydroxybutyrate depolymerase
MQKMIGRFVAIAIALACTLAAPSASPQGSRRLDEERWKVDDVERTALVSLPKNPQAEGPVPVVLVFHGHGGSSEGAARQFRIHEHWPGALVVYPQGLPAGGLIMDIAGKLPGWQHMPEMDGDRDLHLVDAILKWAKSRYTIDPSHTFAAGHSNGGTMVYTLWVARAEKFAAFAPASAVFLPTIIGKAKPKPAFIVAGEHDLVVPYILQDYSLKTVLRLNKTAAHDQEWIGKARRYPANGDKGADVIAYIHGGAHPLPADAGELMVKFFREVAARPDK